MSDKNTRGIKIIIKDPKGTVLVGENDNVYLSFTTSPQLGYSYTFSYSSRPGMDSGGDKELCLKVADVNVFCFVCHFEGEKGLQEGRANKITFVTTAKNGGHRSVAAFLRDYRRARKQT